MCQIFATLNSTLTILARYGYRMTWFIIFLFVLLSPLTSLIDFFSLLTICLSLSLPTDVLSSLDQIPSSSLNLKCLSLSLHLKSNPKNGVGCVACQSWSHTNGNSNSQFKTKPRNGIITNQTDLHLVRPVQHGRPRRRNQTPSRPPPSLFFLLQWLWRCFLGWLLWVVFGGFVFLDGCNGLCLVNLSHGWLIWAVVGWFWDLCLCQSLWFFFFFFFFF